MIVCITASSKVQKQLIYDLIEDMFLPYADEELTLNAEELDLLYQIASAEIPVFDLSRALYSYMPPRGSENDAEAVSGPTPRDDKGTGDGWLRIDLSEATLEEMKEAEKKLHNAIRVRENLHPTTYTNGTRDVATETKTVHLEDGSDLEVAVKTRYYKSKTGKLRKAGKSKARPGEEEIWLTNDELESMS